MSGDCDLVGNFSEISLQGCIMSVNCNVNAGISNFGCPGGPSKGPTVGTMTIAAYAGDVGPIEVGRAGGAVIWQRKYDCDMDVLHFLYVSPGRSFSYGGATDYANIGAESSVRSHIFNASSQSGPSMLYESYDQVEGVGISCSTGPFTVNTGSESGSTFGNLGVGSGDYYLNSFNLDMTNGCFPIVTYSFLFRG